MKKILAALVFILLTQSAYAAQVATPQTDDEEAGGGYCPSLSQTLRRGARDAQTNPQGQVTELQTFLADYFDLDESTAISGFFGRTTQKYLIQFQQAQGLPAYGVAGTLTRAKIAEVCKTGGTGTPGPQCPDYQMPRCSEGEEIAYNSMRNGCKGAPYCKKRDIVACTMEYAPVCGKTKQCGAWDNVRSSDRTTSTGGAMKMPQECVTEKTYSNKCAMRADGAEFIHEGECGGGVICPAIGYMGCPAGTYDANGPTQRGKCPQPPTCKPKPTACPIYNRPQCPTGTSLLSGGTGSDGCELPPRCGDRVTKCGVNTFSVRGARCDVQQSGGQGAAAVLSQRVLEPDSTDPSYTSAYFQCYDGYSETMGVDSSCKPVSVWQKYAQESCAKRCAVTPWDVRSNDGSNGAQLPTQSQAASPYESFMWVVGEVRKLGN